MKFLKKLKMPQWLVLVLTFVVGFSVGLLAWWGVMQVVAMTKKPVVEDHRVPPTEAQHEDSTGLGNQKFNIRVDTRQMILQVNWEKPRAIPRDEFIRMMTAEPRDIDSSIFEELKERYWTPEKEKIGGLLFQVWDMGVVVGGDVADSRIYLLEERSEGLGIGYVYSYLLQDKNAPGKLYLLNNSVLAGNWSLPPSDWSFATYLTQMTRASVEIRTPLESLTLANGKVLHQSVYEPYWEKKYRFLREEDGTRFVEVGRSTDGVVVYNALSVETGNSEGCLYVFGPDGRVYLYRSTIDGSMQSNSEYGSAFVPEFRWSDGSQNISQYETRRTTGCGGYDCVYISSDEEVGPESSLVIVGKTAANDSVYAPKHPKEHKLVKEAYEGWYVPDGKPDLDAFLSKHPYPILFWKDAVGRWTKMQIQDLVPLAECGKPVIYLYPEKATPVSVQLPSFINVTQSEPTYPSKGWRVIAHPDGRLEYADGKTYGSLFWEGTGVGYATPKEGFILKDGEVDQRLQELLAKYGLNETESREFREFWVPKMTGSPYYRVSFLTSEWSQAAPLFVSPRPTSVIRIFMDWQKINAPISIPESTIVTPVRNGFTLVEWGGLLR